MSGNDADEVWAQAHDRLRSIESTHRLRIDEACDVTGTDNGSSRIVAGRSLLNFCSNDYLSLAFHPAVKAGAIDAIKKYGAGCMSSRLVCGTLPVHHELEQALAQFKNAEAALIFSSGYLACVGVIQALSVRADNSRVPVIFDRLAHASLVDGATHDRRNWRSFPHNDVASLQAVLEKLEIQEWPSAIVVTEGVFSMDGDVAPLRDMSELCARHNAILLVDDAHGTGVMGENGEGVVGMEGLSGEPHIVQIGTLSKALGSQGGFVVGPKVLRDLLVNTSRTFIFDTGLTPGAAGAALAALQIVNDEPGRLAKLRQNTLLFRSLLNRLDCNEKYSSPIIPILFREEEQALAAAGSLRTRGFLVAAIRPPTVPTGTSRLRVTISCAHKEEDIRRLAQVISQMETA